jgi:hypothetical protein
LSTGAVHTLYRERGRGDTNDAEIVRSADNADVASQHAIDLFVTGIDEKRARREAVEFLRRGDDENVLNSDTLENVRTDLLVPTAK